MKPRFLYKSVLFKLPLLRRYQAICLGRLIFCKHDEEAVGEKLRVHELAHQAQMDRHGMLGFYFIYLKDYFANLARFRNHDRAYRHIPFEIQAREEEDSG